MKFDFDCDVLPIKADGERTGSFFVRYQGHSIRVKIGPLPPELADVKFNLMMDDNTSDYAVIAISGYE